MVFTEADYSNFWTISVLAAIRKSSLRMNVVPFVVRPNVSGSRVESCITLAGGRQRATCEGWLRLKRRRRGFSMLVTLQLKVL